MMLWIITGKVIKGNGTTGFCTTEFVKGKIVIETN